ncbi:MAG: CoA transferase [Deltaproteobacteria bacterium]|nr:CoA transferase [Deltaproteobacteria bacterium]MBI3386666.1 CoA transferase [Deltaproteobacteria bacterium]
MLPLANLRLLDLSRQLPGPFCSTLLADLGMDTLVIAQPGDPFGTGIPFLARNKRSMTLNLKSDAGRDIFFRLAERADVVLEGFRPGVTKRLGIDYATLSARNPRLICCSISGYGQDGPYRDRVGHDVNYLGFAGVLHSVGEAERAPVMPGVQIADIGAGSLMAAVGILTAVIARQHTGRGQCIDIAMLDGAFAWNVYNLLLRQLSGANPRRGREQLTGGYACYNVYETRDGRHVTVGAYEPHFWATLCRHMGRDDLIPLQWDEARREEIVEYFRAIFRKKTFDDWMRELGGKDICFGPVNTIDEALRDPQLRHRNMIVEMDTPLGKMVTPNSPIKLSDTPPSLRTPPAAFGEHTDETLEQLGFGQEQIKQFREQGIV